MILIFFFFNYSRSKLQFMVIEWFLFKQSHGDGDTRSFEPVYQHRKLWRRFTAHPYLVALYSTLGPFGFGCSTNLLLTDAAKFMIGRLRPHFVSVCQPDWSKFNCTDAYGAPAYIQDIPCLGTDEHMLTDARWVWKVGFFMLFYVSKRVSQRPWLYFVPFEDWWWCRFVFQLVQHIVT